MADELPISIITHSGFSLCHCGGLGCRCQAPRGDYHDYVPAYTRLVEMLQPSRVLEWGPGPNTDIALKAGARVWAVESQRKWLKEPAANLVQLFVAESAERYADAPAWLGLDFDLFFVDGRRRSECFQAAHKAAIHGSRKAVAALHDCQRSRYWTGLKAWRYVCVPVGVLAIATDDEPTYERVLESLAADCEIREWNGSP